MIWLPASKKTPGEARGCMKEAGILPDFFPTYRDFDLRQGSRGPIWPPRSNARASGPRGYATTSSVLAIVLVAGSFDRFVN
jgi:hypothetical protein